MALVLAAALLAPGLAGAATPDAAPPATPSDKGKRSACVTDVAAKKLRGTDRLDAIQICMAEGRLDCVKTAVAQKIPPSSRKVFLQTCMIGSAGQSAKGKP